jgi:sRNA-binding carbon storage regulator CsrA
MLVLTRHIDDGLRIMLNGTVVRVVVLGIEDGKVKLGIDAAP